MCPYLVPGFNDGDDEEGTLQTRVVLQQEGVP